MHIVAPEYQGRGLGRRIMDAITAYLDREAAPGTAIGLMAAPDAVEFYEKYGYVVRPSGRYGPGMMRIR